MKPLIFDFKTSRVEQNLPLSYQYDDEKCLNVIEVDGKKIDFIDCDKASISLKTQTRVSGEAEDFRDAGYEMSTITKIGGERQDMHDILLELKTKTFTVSERDDK